MKFKYDFEVIELFPNGFSVIFSGSEKMIPKSQITSIILTPKKNRYVTLVTSSSSLPENIDFELAPQAYQDIMTYLFVLPDVGKGLYVLRLSTIVMRYWEEGLEIIELFGHDRKRAFISKNALETVRFSFSRLSATFVYSGGELRFKFVSGYDSIEASRFLKQVLLIGPPPIPQNEESSNSDPPTLDITEVT